MLRPRLTVLAAVAGICLTFHAGSASAAERDTDHKLVLEISPAGEWPLGGGPSNFGGMIAAEVTPIENWLELEFGMTALGTAGKSELSADLLFKKPFRISPTFEFMIGAGPSFTQALSGPEHGSQWSAEFALDFMFWPTKNVGWFVEPTWSIAPRTGEHSIGVSVGLLIGFH